MRFLSGCSTDRPCGSAVSSEPEWKWGITVTGQVVLVGASVRSLAESAVAAGLRPLCCDFFGDRDLLQLLESGGGRFLGRLQSFADLPGLLRMVPGAVPLVWSGGLENAPEVLEELSHSGRPIAGCDPVAVRAVRNWRNLSEWVAGSGVGFPETRACHGPIPGGDWLVKSERSAGGAGVWRVNGGLDERVRALTPFGGAGLLLQRRVPGLPISMVFFFSAGRAALLGASLQFCGWRSLGAGSREYLWCGNGGPIRLSQSLQRRAVAAAEFLAAGAGLRGVCGLDFVLSGQDLWLLEVNPRIPASHWIYDSAREGLSLRLQLGQAGLEGWVGVAKGFRMQLVVWCPQRGDAEMPWPAMDGLPAGVRLADAPGGEALQPGNPAFSLLLETDSPAGALRVLQSAGESSDDGGLFWRHAAADLAADLQNFRLQVPLEAEDDETGE